MQNIILCPPRKFGILFCNLLILTIISLFFTSALSAQACQPVTFYVDAPEDVSFVGNRYRITVRADINASNQSTFKLSGILLTLNVTADMGTPTIVAAGAISPVTGTISGSGAFRQLSFNISIAANALNIADNGALFFIEVTGVPSSELTITLSQPLNPPTVSYSYPSVGQVISCNQGAIGGTTVNNGVTTVRPSFVKCSFATATLYGETRLAK
jgi:hypothetical protein